MKSNIILVGLMGAGKSTIGRGLAHLMDMEFYDSDRVIEQRTGVDISTIFEIEGEQGFRDREEQIIAELCARKNCVLATGGGSVLRKANREAMKQGGHVVYLRTSADVLFSRIRYDKSRPLMQTAQPIKTLQDLLCEREPFYQEVADTVIKTGRQKVAVIVKRLHQLLKDRLKSTGTDSISEKPATGAIEAQQPERRQASKETDK